MLTPLYRFAARDRVELARGSGRGGTIERADVRYPGAWLVRWDNSNIATIEKPEQLVPEGAKRVEPKREKVRAAAARRSA